MYLNRFRCSAKIMGNFFTLILRNHRIENQWYPVPGKGTEHRCLYTWRAGGILTNFKPANNQTICKNKSMLTSVELTYPSSANWSTASEIKVHQQVSGPRSHSRISVPIKIWCAIVLCYCPLPPMEGQYLDNPLTRDHGEEVLRKGSWEKDKHWVWSGFPGSED